MSVGSGGEELHEMYLLSDGGWGLFAVVCALIHGGRKGWSVDSAVMYLIGRGLLARPDTSTNVSIRDCLKGEIWLSMVRR